MTRAFYIALTAFGLMAPSGCGGTQKTPARSDSTEAKVKTAEKFQRARQYDKARAAYKDALDTAPNDRSRGYAAREFGLALVFWGEVAAGEQMLEAAVKYAPTRPASWHDLGILRSRRGNPVGAEQAFARLIELAPGDARPRIALAAMLVNQKRFVEAEKQYRVILTLSIPDRIRTAIERALRLIAAERARSAS